MAAGRIVSVGSALEQDAALARGEVPGCDSRLVPASPRPDRKKRRLSPWKNPRPDVSPFLPSGIRRGQPLRLSPLRRELPDAGGEAEREQDRVAGPPGTPDRIPGNT